MATCDTCIYRFSNDADICSGCVVVGGRYNNHCLGTPLSKPPVDTVVTPKHYEIVPGLQAKHVMQALMDNAECFVNKGEPLPPIIGYYYGNVIKYVLRCTKKNGVEDLKKAKQYIDFILKEYDDGTND